MGRGDTFNPTSTRLDSLNPDQEKWTDRVEYLLRLLSGYELSRGEQAVVNVDSSAFTALGQPKDSPASASTLNTAPTTAYSQIQLLKALLLLDSAIAGSVDNIEPQLSSIISSLNAVNTNLNDVNSSVSSVEVEVAGLSTAFSSFVTANHSDLIAIKTLVQSVLDALTPSEPTYSYHVSSSIANTDTVIELTAVTGHRRILEGVAWSYAGGAVTGRLEISDGTTLFSIDILQEGHGSISFPKPIRSDIGSPLIITLHAGGAGIIGYLNSFAADTE